MGIAAAIIGALSIITTALGVLTIIQIPAEPILSDKLTWPFWFGCSVIMILGSMLLMMARRENVD